MKQSIFSSLLLLLFFHASFALAQKNVTLNGYVREAGSGESLTGAGVYNPSTQQGVVANKYGFYSLSLPPGVYTIKVSFAGFESQTMELNLTADKRLDFSLKQMKQQIDEVTVTGQSASHNINSTEMGVTHLSIGEIKKLPVLFGETDIMKTLQLLPGVQGAGEGNAGFYIRGGGPDQNLVLLDNATVYNTGHLLGFFSVFNGDAIKNVTLTKGIAPANYGGRLSSVVDVEMKDGNKESYHGSGGIGLISSRLTLEGPIVKDKSSFLISGRRTYLDVLMQPFLKENMKGTGYYFYDINAKADWELGQKDHLFLSGYFGKDVFSFHSNGGTFNAHIPWGNSIGSLRWNHQFSPKLFLNTTTIYNQYHFSFRASENDFDIGFKTAIRDVTGKIEMDYYPDSRHQVKFGANITKHRFVPNQASGSSGEIEFAPDNSLVKHAFEAGLFVMDEWTISQGIKINAGLRYSWFGQVGPYTHYLTGQNGQKIDSTFYEAGTVVKSYSGLEPRLSGRIKLQENSSLKLGLGKTFQYLSMVSNNGSALPTDIWVPSTAIVSPQKAWQYSLGYFQNFFDNAIETSIEVYYKKLRNQIEYRAGYVPSTLRDAELDFVFGTGDAYGAEFFFRKNAGSFTGWIGYTLAWTW